VVSSAGGLAQARSGGLRYAYPPYAVTRVRGFGGYAVRGFAVRGDAGTRVRGAWLGEGAAEFGQDGLAVEFEESFLVRTGGVEHQVAEA